MLKGNRDGPAPECGPVRGYSGANIQAKGSHCAICTIFSTDIAHSLRLTGF
jgi:hypothetical protein